MLVLLRFPAPPAAAGDCRTLSRAGRTLSYAVQAALPRPHTPGAVKFFGAASRVLRPALPAQDALPRCRLQPPSRFTPAAHPSVPCREQRPVAAVGRFYTDFTKEGFFPLHKVGIIKSGKSQRKIKKDVLL